MKSLNQYLIESEKQYVYRVKIAGEIDKTKLQNFKSSLSKFDIVNSTEMKKTPITKNPVGFPHLSNEEVSFFDITLNYPASSEQVLELGRILGIDPNTMVVIDKQFDDSMQEDSEKVESDGLIGKDVPKDTAEQNKASKDYADSYQNIVKNADTTKMEFVADISKNDTTTTNDLPVNTTGPFSKISRPDTKDLA